MSAPQSVDVDTPDRDTSRVHWMELFFDLIFVALVGQLAHGLHEEPAMSDLLTFVALFATVWWAWVNLTFVVNVSQELTRRGLAAVMLTAMFAAGAIAVAAPEALDERAWLFAAGNAALRALLLVLWLRRTWNTGAAARTRVISYNGLTSVIWLASIWVPAPVNYALWTLAILIEIVMLFVTLSGWGPAAMARINTEHLAERFGLLVIIVLGESVLTLVGALSGHWDAAAGLTAAMALLLLCGLAWSFFIYSADAMRDGLEALQHAGDIRTIRDTVAFFPFLLVAGLTIISGTVAVGIHHPDHVLPFASALSLGVGIALFYLANALISWRFGARRAAVLRWAVPAVALPLAMIPVLLLVSAEAGFALALAVTLFIVASTEINAFRRRRRAERITD